MNAVSERLHAGKVAAQGDLVTWWCRNGRTIEAPRDANGVWCTGPGCNHSRVTNAMKPRAEYPNWGPSDG